MNNELNIGIIRGWIKMLEQISSEWDGTKPGVKENRAKAASDAISRLDELEGLFNELEF